MDDGLAKALANRSDIYQRRVALLNKLSEDFTLGSSAKNYFHILETIKSWEKEDQDFYKQALDQGVRAPLTPGSVVPIAASVSVRERSRSPARKAAAIFSG